MQLESQVVSLPLAKRLKELGVKQESIFWWLHEPEINDYTISNSFGSFDVGWEKECAAFTVAELGEMLPDEIKVGRITYGLTITKEGLDGWRADYLGSEYGEPDTAFDDAFNGQTEAEARAHMLIYLIEKGMVKP